MKREYLTTVEIIKDEIAGLDSTEISQLSEYLVRDHPAVADRMLTELNWSFMDQDPTLEVE